jgi:hypothetical protein
MALKLSIGCRDGLANTQGFNEMFDGGTLRIMSGVSPGIEFGVTGAELLAVTVNPTSAGLGRVYVQEGANVSNTGTAGYFRLSAAGDDPVMNSEGTAIRAEGTCGVIEESCELLFTGLRMTAGNYMTVYGNFRISE